jgi:hypothetical protein
LVHIVLCWFGKLPFAKIKQFALLQQDLVLRVLFVAQDFNAKV